MKASSQNDAAHSRSARLVAVRHSQRTATKQHQEGVTFGTETLSTSDAQPGAEHLRSLQVHQKERQP